MSESQLELLIARCAGSDRDAFTQLYRATASKLYGLGLRILQNRELAEDAMQEVYVRVWEKAGTYQRELGQPSTWLGIIMRRHCLDLLRRQKVRVPFSGDVIDPDVLASEQDGPYRRAVTSESGEFLALCMSRLEKMHRKVIAELYIEGSTQEEIARRLSVPVGTIKSWSRRCMQKLRECILALGSRDGRP